MAHDPVNTTESDGEACCICGEDAVVGVLVQGHICEVPLCDTCADNVVTKCAGCDNTFWMREGTRIYGNPNLYCIRCAKQINEAIAAKRPAPSFDQVRR
jgi:hypothetical protein